MLILLLRYCCFLVAWRLFSIQFVDWNSRRFSLVNQGFPCKQWKGSRNYFDHEWHSSKLWLFSLSIIFVVKNVRNYLQIVSVSRSRSHCQRFHQLFDVLPTRRPGDVHVLSIRLLLFVLHRLHICFSNCEKRGKSFDTFMTQSLQAHSTVEIGRLLKAPQGPSNGVLLTIPYLNIPVSHQNFDLARHSVNVVSNFQLLGRTLTAEVSSRLLRLLSPNLINFNHFQSAQELVTFTAISFASSVYSLACYVIKFHTFTREQKAVQFIMNMAAILNIMFLICYIFENCKHVYMAPKN